MADTKRKRSGAFVATAVIGVLAVGCLVAWQVMERLAEEQQAQPPMASSETAEPELDDWSTEELPLQEEPELDLYVADNSQFSDAAPDTEFATATPAYEDPGTGSRFTAPAARTPSATVIPVGGTFPSVTAPVADASPPPARLLLPRPAGQPDQVERTARSPEPLDASAASGTAAPASLAIADADPPPATPTAAAPRPRSLDDPPPPSLSDPPRPSLDSPPPPSLDGPPPPSLGDLPSTSRPILQPPPRSAIALPPANITPPTRRGIPGTGAAEPAIDTTAPPAAAADVEVPSTDGLIGDGTVGDDAPHGPQQPQVTIEKIAPARARPGQPLVYTIRIRNTGKIPAGDVLVEDRIPLGCRLTGTIPQAELLDKSLRWQLGTIAAGQERKLHVRVVPTGLGTIGSVAVVSFTASVASRTTIALPKLKVSVSAPKKARVGKQLTLTYRLVNTGDSDVTDLILRSLIPAEFTHPDGNDLEYDLARLAAGATKEISLIVKATRAGTAISRATLSDKSGVISESEESIEVVESDLSLTRSAPQQVSIGGSTTLTTTVSNDDDQAASKVTQLTEVLPAGVSFVSATEDGRYDAAGRTVTWRVDPIAPKKSRPYSVTVLPQQTGTFTSRVELAGGNSVSSTTMIRGFASIAIGISGTDQAIRSGQPVAVALTLKNRGTSPATAVAVTITLPEQLQLVKLVGPVKFSISGRSIVLEPIREIAAGTSTKITLELASVAPGDSRLFFQVTSDQLNRPLAREESLAILPAQ